MDVVVANLTCVLWSRLNRVWKHVLLATDGDFASFDLLFSFPMPGAGKETNLVQFHDGFEFLSFAGQASQLFLAVVKVPRAHLHLGSSIYILWYSLHVKLVIFLKPITQNGVFICFNFIFLRQTQSWDWKVVQFPRIRVIYTLVTSEEYWLLVEDTFKTSL